MPGMPVADFDQRLEFVLCMHDSSRWLVSREPGTKEGHFINENTVVRLAAMMEAVCINAPGGKATHETDWPEVCVRTLFLLRNIIVHETDGHFQPDRLTGSRKHLPAFEKFCECHPEAEVAQGDKLRLPYREVIEPLVEGCREYWRARKPDAP